MAEKNCHWRIQEYCRYQHLNPVNDPVWHAPIGVFDSGVGGLSVLRALRAELPAEAFVYLADSGHAPYGERDDTHVIARARTLTRYLLERHRIKALVVACNTATAAAIHLLRQEFAHLPIVGIEPALKPAVALTRTGTVGVMATRGTLSSAKFRGLQASLENQARFVLQRCDGLADAIERSDATKIEALCSNYTGAMGQFGSMPGAMDVLVLGCTHYPFASDVLQRLVGEDVRLLEGGAPVARQTRRRLAEHGLLHPELALADSGTPLLRAYTTGIPAGLQDALARWLDIRLAVNTPELAAGQGAC